MTIWIIEPRDPLIVRDGRPFGPNPGARAATLPFPLPSTIVGGLRHKAGLDDAGVFNREDVARVLGLGLRGPLLVEITDDGALGQFLFPAPADALVLDADGSDPGTTELRIQALAPHALAGAPKTNQPDGMALIAPATRVPNKVSGAAPRFWHQQYFNTWLTAPAPDATVALDAVGLRGLESDARTHVSVQPDTQTAREGALFQTRGLEFTWRDRVAWAEREAFVIRRLALAAAFEDKGTPYTPPHFPGGLAPLGGERRLMRWSAVERTLPEPPPGLFDAIVEARQARVILLTPALFAAGYRPPVTWMRGGGIAHLRAAAVPRAQVISGWDLNADNGVDERGRPRPRGKPKATRRLAPAGAVYFVTWESGADVRAWLDATWMQNVSDADQDQRDGFGLAALGVWPR